MAVVVGFWRGKRSRISQMLEEVPQKEKAWTIISRSKVLEAKKNVVAHFNSKNLS